MTVFFSFTNVKKKGAGGGVWKSTLKTVCLIWNIYEKMKLWIPIQSMFKFMVSHFSRNYFFMFTCGRQVKVLSRTRTIYGKQGISYVWLFHFEHFKWIASFRYNVYVQVYCSVLYSLVWGLISRLRIK